MGLWNSIISIFKNFFKSENIKETPDTQKDTIVKEINYPTTLDGIIMKTEIDHLKFIQSLKTLDSWKEKENFRKIYKKDSNCCICGKWDNGLIVDGNQTYCRDHTPLYWYDNYDIVPVNMGHEVLRYEHK